MIISCSHSHAFHGVRVELLDAELKGGTCQVQFGDGVTVLGFGRKAGDGYALELPAYTTTAGTRITPKEWSMAPDLEGHWRLRTVASSHEKSR